MGPARKKETSKVENPHFCRLLMDSSPIPTAFVDGESHTIRYVNPAFRQLVGDSQQELIGESFFHALPGSRECLGMLNRVKRTGRAEIYTGQEHFPSDSLFFSYVLWPVPDVDGHRMGIMVQVTESTPFHIQSISTNEAIMLGSVRQHELTETAEKLNAQLQQEILRRKQVQEEMVIQELAVKASERRYRGLIEAIPQIVWTAMRDGTIDFANTKWDEHFGIDLQTFNQEGWLALLHHDDQDRTMETWARGLNSGTAFQIEHRLRNISTNRYRWYFTRAVPLPGEDGEVVKWFGTSTDVEDQKRAELAVFKKQKLESLGVLAGGIAHDFNNLLTGVIGGASLVADSLPPSHSLQPILGGVVSSGERAAHLTRQMLAYAGKGSFLVEQIDLNELVRSTYALLRGSIPNYVHVTLDLRRDLTPVEADMGQMQQIAMNLILNSAEAIVESKGGSVTVKTNLIDVTSAFIEKTELILGSLTPGRYVVLEVKDDGLGMNKETLAKIFDPFYTTKFTGRGLGLAAVEGILRTQKGALAVRSTLEIGSTFCVYLPTSAKQRRSAKTPMAAVKSSRTGTILVVDDEEIVRRAAQLALENAGFSVRLADGGDEALRILRSEAQPTFSLILLDLSMPGTSGKQAMQQIRELQIGTPILVCSGYSEEETLKEFSGLDIAGFVQKPFTARQIANRVSAILNREAIRSPSGHAVNGQ